MRIKHKNRQVHPLRVFHKNSHKGLRKKHPHHHLREYALVFLGILVLFAMTDIVNDGDRNKMLQSSMLDVSRVKQVGYKMKFDQEKIYAKSGEVILLKATLDPPGIDENNPVQVRFTSTVDGPSLLDARTPDGEMLPVRSTLLTSSNNKDFYLNFYVPEDINAPKSMVVIGECEVNCGAMAADATTTIEIIDTQDIE